MTHPRIAFLLALIVFFSVPSLANAQTASTCVFDTYLSRGAKDVGVGGKVFRLQQLLAQKLSVSSADVATGFFGPKTETLVAQYQKVKGLETTGALGPKTRNALAQDCAGAVATTTSTLPLAAATSTSGVSCPVISVPTCTTGTLAYMGRDAKGCSLGYQCAPFMFTPTTTPVVYLPNISGVAPAEFLATSTIIFTKFPSGTTTERTAFVMGEPNSVYTELDSSKRICLRVMSSIDGNKEVCAALSLNVIYRLELSAILNKVRLVLNDTVVASVTARPNAPKEAFRVGSKGPDSSGRKGPLIGSLQMVALVGTTTQSAAGASVNGVRCPVITPLQSCYGTVLPIGFDSNGCSLGFYCREGTMPAPTKPTVPPPLNCPVFMAPACSGTLVAAGYGSDGCPLAPRCVN